MSHRSYQRPAPDEITVKSADLRLVLPRVDQGDMSALENGALNRLCVAASTDLCPGSLERWRNFACPVCRIGVRALSVMGLITEKNAPSGGLVPEHTRGRAA